MDHLITTVFPGFIHYLGKSELFIGLQCIPMRPVWVSVCAVWKFSGRDDIHE